MQKILFTFFTATWLALFLTIVLVADGQRSDPIKRALSQLSLEPTITEINDNVGVDRQVNEADFDGVAVVGFLASLVSIGYATALFTCVVDALPTSNLRHVIWTRGPPPIF